MSATEFLDRITCCTSHSTLPCKCRSLCAVGDFQEDGPIHVSNTWQLV